VTHFSSPGQTVSSSGYFYWGNVPAFDCLNLVENEGDDYSSGLKVLYFGVGDLRNVALTCASLPDSYSNKVLFTLNDKESCVLARLVLLLYMLIKGINIYMLYIIHVSHYMHSDLLVASGKHSNHATCNWLIYLYRLSERRVIL
jgi:hypothetical protein